MFILVNSLITIVMILCCIALNQFAYVLFGYSSIAFQMITPINEETLRLISVSRGAPLCWMFTTFMVIHEFIIYTQMIDESMGHLPIKFILLRVACGIFHFFLLFIQLYGWKLYKKSNKKIHIIGAYMFTIGLHYMWNSKISFLVMYLIS